MKLTLRLLLLLPLLQLMYVSAARVTECPQQCSCSSEDQGSLQLVCFVASISEWDVLCGDLTAYIELLPSPDLKVVGNLSGVVEFSDCLPKLKSFDVSDTSIDVRLNTFQGLEVDGLLNLSSNGITNLQAGVFEGLENLKVLDLSKNSISNLKSQFFEGLSSLRVLHLGVNNFTFISAESFINLPSLEHLDLQYNKLDQLPSLILAQNATIKVLNLRGNNLSTMKFAGNETDAAVFQNISALDISDNPLACSCMLEKFVSFLPNFKAVMKNPSKTICDSPLTLKGKSIVDIDISHLLCSAPVNIMSYPSSEKSVITTGSLTLECHADGYPEPSILWITPWNDKFISDAQYKLYSQEVQSDEGKHKFYTYREYSEPNVLMTSSLRVNDNNDLVIEKFRGSMSGNFTCVAFNVAGNISAVMSLMIHSEMKSDYMYSLFIGGYCASASLILGFIIGGIKMLVVIVKRKLYFIVPLFSKSPSMQPPGDNTSTTFSADLPPDNPPSDDDSQGPEDSEPGSPLLVHNTIDLDYVSPDEAHSPESRRPHSFLETFEEAKGKLRYGVGRKMERVRKNVQSIRESGSVYVHNIVESGSTAASRMKAGVVMGVETMKYHVQSFKELCGTGDMGLQTISMVSVETDVDSSECKEVVRQITYV